MKKAKHKTITKAKKEAWVEFSKFIRMRDGLKTTGSIDWCLCCTCQKRYHFKMLQAGHFVAGRHNGNLFSERGTHAQCYNCNINLKGNTLEYRRKIIELYGEGADLELEAEAKKSIQYKVNELEVFMETFKQKQIELQGQNKINLRKDVFVEI